MKQGWEGQKDLRGLRVVWCQVHLLDREKIVLNYWLNFGFFSEYNRYMLLAALGLLAESIYDNNYPDICDTCGLLCSPIHLLELSLL